MAPVQLTDKDVDQIVRVVATEADHRLMWSHPEAYTAQVHGIVDTVLNRVASGRWGNSVASVANADRQFSAINGPGSQGYGSVDRVPDSAIPSFLPNIVTSWVTARANGTPSSVGGNLHYANPLFSDAANQGWIGALDGPELGFGNSMHRHGTTAGFTPIEAQVVYGSGGRLNAIHDREAARLGYGELPPVPLNRPGSEPRPTTMSPALQAARQRLAAAREMRSNAAANGATDSAAMAVTPRLTSSNGQVDGIVDTRPQLDWGEFRPGASVGGVGSLLDGGIDPAAPNPSKPPVAGLRLPTAPTTITGKPDAPIGSMPAARLGTTVTGRPDAPIGSMPAATQPDGKPGVGLKAPASSASGPAAGRPGGATTVANNGGKIDAAASTNAGVGPVVREQQTAKLPNGKTVTVGQSYIIGNKLVIADVGADGKAVLRDVSDVRDQFLREHVDQNAPLLFENSIAGNVARSIAAPMIRGQIEQAGSAARDAAGSLVNSAISTVGGLATQARDAVGNLFTLRPPATPAPTSANANLNSARAEQSAMRSSSPSSSSSTTVRPGNTLTAPGAGLTPEQRNAIAAVPLSASVRPLTPSPSTPRTTTTTQTVTNPAYTEWVKKYGDGSQVQTAATGGMITKNQLAAIQNVSGAIQAPIVHAPPPPPKTITVTKTTQLPAQSTTPPAPRPSPIVAIGGYLYDSSQRTPTGAMLRLGRVGSPIGNTLTTVPRTTSPAPLTGTARVAASLGLNPGSVAAMEAWHGGGGGGGGPAVGGDYGGGGNNESPRPTYSVSGYKSSFA